MASSVDTLPVPLTFEENMTVSTTLPSYEYMHSNYIPTVALMIKHHSESSIIKSGSEHLVFIVVFR